MVKVVVDQTCILGEGPGWDAKRKTICWIDIIAGLIHEYGTIDGSYKKTSVNQMIGSIAFCKDGNFIAALKNGFGLVNRDSGMVKMFANPEPDLPGNRFNDGKCDPAG